MLKTLVAAGALAWAMTLVAPSLEASQAEERQGYDLLFRTGTLDDVPRDATLLYRREVSNAILPDAAERDTGEIALATPPASSPLAELEFRQGERHRRLGSFPLSVGNPMIMYFYESVIRDMAETAGGSAFYIRNRIKESLVAPAHVAQGETIVDGKPVPTVTVTLSPFSDDPNRDRMRGFGDLELQVTMSQDVPGWYLSMLADATPEGASEPIYRTTVTFESVEARE